MNKLFRSTVALTVLLAGAVFAQAQTSEPIVVVSLPSYNELLATVDFGAQLGGQPSPSMMVNGMLQGLKGLDKTKPIGVALMTKGSEMSPVVFVPSTSAKELADTLTMFHAFTGPAEDDGGVLKATCAGGQDVYLREQSGWTFATMTKDVSLPSDPVKLLAGLNPEYCVAVRVYLKNVPAEQRKSAMEKFRGFMAFAAAAQRQQDNPLSALSEKNLDAQVDAIERLLNEADQFTIGWKLDRQAKNTHLDISFTALPGSQLDQEMQQLAKAKTNFAGFLVPEAALSANFSGTNSPQNIQEAVSALDQLKQKMEEAIDKDADLPDDNARTQVKNVLNQFVDVLQKTVKSGKSDGGILVQLGPEKLQAAVGGYIADGPGLEKAVKSLVDLAKGEPKFSEMATVKFDLETHRDVKFHQVSIKLPEEADEGAKKVFGDTVDLYLGVGPDSTYVGLGKGSLDLVKSVIDRSAAEPNKAVPPFQMSIALGPILQFAASMDHGDPKVGMMAQMFDMSKGKDHILINAKPISNGVMYRVEVESGIFEALQQMGKMAMNHQGGPAGAPPSGFAPN